VSKRVSPTDRLRTEVDELFGSGRDLAAILEDVARVSVRLMLQTALEAEVAVACRSGSGPVSGCACTSCHIRSSRRRERCVSALVAGGREAPGHPSQDGRPP